MTAQFAESSATVFDPTAGRFVAQARRPDAWSDVDPASLTPLMRALLVIDGTVTKILEAYFLEPVDVQRISQSVDDLGGADVWLEANAGERIVRREVVLVGRASQRVYTYAQSTIMLDRLTGRMEAGLDADNFGLGRILLDSAAEMRRECLWYGRQRLAHLPAPLMAHADEALVSRTYRVIKGGSPLMMITERFPPDVSDNPNERRR
ncbi:MAG: chorismate--pyruvate lyase family protein [Gammaproteobacteria bacterium]